MIVPRPIFCRRSNENVFTTTLYFEGNKSSDFYMRGAVAFPDNNQEGFALLAGKNLQTGIIYLFEEWPFWTIEHWLNEDGTLHKREDGWKPLGKEDSPDGSFHLGLVQFLQDNFSLYKCVSYFWNQHTDIWMRYSKAVYENRMTPTGLELIEVPHIREIGDNLIDEYFQLERIRGSHGSMIHKAVETFMNLRDANNRGDNTIIHALRCLIAGYEYAPWRDVKR